MTKSQVQALKSLSLTKWECAYGLQQSLSTLFSLENRGFALCKGRGEPGAFSNPRMCLDFRLTATGYAALKEIEHD
ncbi:hypothetical protein LCGC14_3100380 [marine sediment metagenome]|uniref:Uncharacterized protein n=1 Tax=marine sediment metagenome TaxID=412755 RepID=A0A0F8W8F8_9ZZZZ